ncbi:MAG TPA: type I glyceraldehyde-3-phosphate dehydrogenase [Acidimicrobiia bacterium]|jgi:glyceraldehyde 3-phosphate dehydrogenase|nr:type I glyceraldehyde-3-phosphate dehydrogenase [Acidimicrobiia bacterium]
MDPIRIGINGFGRIGRCTFKLLVADERFEVAGINDLADIGDLAYLLKYDSVHGWYPRKVSNDATSIMVGDHKVGFYSEREPEKIPWGDLGVDVVVESTGAFRARADAARHIAAGARKVVISAPSSDADVMLAYKVNHHLYDPDEHHVVSNASCTTNCLAPVARVLVDRFGVDHLMVSTVHAYTSSQALTDTPTRKRRRGRAAALSIIPTSTGAAQATAEIVPELAGKCDGMAFRIPIEDGSVVDAVAALQTDVTVDDVNQALADAAEGPMNGVLRVSDEELVSRDIIGDPHSSVIDAASTMVLAGRVAKVIAWYDNEWGYSARMVDMCGVVAGSG